MEASSSATNSAIGSNSSIVPNQRKAKEFQGFRIENPFTFKVGQVFTGFGVGCGIGIGAGRPINLGNTRPPPTPPHFPPDILHLKF